VSEASWSRLILCRELWREDGKLAQIVLNGRQQMQDAERGLQGMMDKVGQTV